MKGTPILKQLTSLRFFGALIVVFAHCNGAFGIKNANLNLAQIVSFFFVLSGFVLTYAYPQIQSFKETKKFWLARIARIWPAYFLSILLALVLLHYPWNYKLILANFFMIQAWIPKSAYYFSYNALCWSVSTEMFFYLIFPILIYNFHKNWKIKFLLSVCLVILTVVVTQKLHLPEATDPFHDPERFFVTKQGLLYINPISRFFEFVVGMLMALLWKNYKLPSKYFWSTSIEIVSIALCFFSIYLSIYLSKWIVHTRLGTSGQWSVISSSSCVVFGLTLYVIASGNGWISKVLSKRIFVRLGEISFCVYLFHQMIISFYTGHLAYFSKIPNSLAFTLFLFVSFMLGYIMWRFVEVPCKELILRKNVKRERVRIDEQLLPN